MTMKDRSPFTPGNPVPVELFVGRTKQLEEILRNVKQARTGKQENIFLAGERGIGKSSFAKFVCNMACKERLLSVHVFLGQVTSLDEMVRRVFEELLKASNTQSWYGKISGYFENKIQQIDLFGVAVSFHPTAEDKRELVNNFPEALANIAEKIKTEKKGLFIVLDDIDTISKTPEFANWYKSFVDKVATHFDYFPISIMLIGLPEFRDNLSRNQPSLMRVFRVVEIEKLQENEVKDFFLRAFNKVNITVEESAMEIMVDYSGGLPTIMHEIGDAIFWIDDDGIVKDDDVWKGVISAAESIGKKYLDPLVYRAIRSEKYRSILRKLGVTTSFKKSEIVAKLTKEEKAVFDNFLRTMRDRGVIMINQEADRGTYKFVNDIYPVYIFMEGLEHKMKAKQHS
ncbi:MAG: ATP-binding protein [Methanothrix sp.]|jgi:AAA+ ATPase superfamily predicted ATPase|nr:ATP-binding protein [Methanothrix sp.]